MVATEVKRGLVKKDKSRGPVGVSLAMATAWLAASVVLCTSSPGPLSVISFVFAGLMSAANIAGYRGGTGGVVSERAMLPIVAVLLTISLIFLLKAMLLVKSLTAMQTI